MKIFWWGMVKNGYDQSGLWTTKLTVFQDWTNGIKWVFACWYKFMQIKRCLKILGLAWSKMHMASHAVGLENWQYLRVNKWNKQYLRVNRWNFLHIYADWKYELSWLFGCWQWCNSFLLDWYPTLSFLNAEDPLQLYFLFKRKTV